MVGGNCCTWNVVEVLWASQVGTDDVLYSFAVQRDVLVHALVHGLLYTCCPITCSCFSYMGGTWEGYTCSALGDFVHLFFLLLGCHMNMILLYTCCAPFALFGTSDRGTGAVGTYTGLFVVHDGTCCCGRCGCCTWAVHGDGNSGVRLGRWYFLLPVPVAVRYLLLFLVHGTLVHVVHCRWYVDDDDGGTWALQMVHRRGTSDIFLFFCCAVFIVHSVVIYVFLVHRDGRGKYMVHGRTPCIRCMCVAGGEVVKLVHVVGVHDQ